MLNIKNTEDPIKPEIISTFEEMPYRPVLPSKAGYVEVNGEYVPTEETLKILRLEEKIAHLIECNTDIYIKLIESEIATIDDIPDSMKESVTAAVKFEGDA